MKRIISLFLVAALLLTLSGCKTNSGTSRKTGNQPAGVADVLEQGISEAENKNNDSDKPQESMTSDKQQGADQDSSIPESSAVPEPDSSAASEAEQEEASEEVDLDLTTLSSTMVYSEVYNMMMDPKKYMGKTIKMDGLFATYHDEKKDKYYFACIIQDATACCAQGMEFSLAGDHTYPDDYPELYEEICVIGIFDLYEEDGNTYCTLRDARFV